MRNLNSLSVQELDAVIREYPWFSLARREIYLKLTSYGEEYSQEGLKKLYFIYNPRYVIKDGVKNIRLNPVTPPPATIESGSRIHILGGDYFSREDVESEGKIKIQPIQDERPKGEYNNKAGDEFNSETFFTETLARIYVEQGFYDRAIDVYSKLILLYPRKSVYFASLIEELKKN